MLCVFLSSVSHSCELVSPSWGSWEPSVCGQVGQKWWVTWGPNYLQLAAEVGTVLWDQALHPWNLLLSP